MDGTEFAAFSDIRYERPDIEAYKARKHAYIEAFSNASSYGEARELYMRDDADGQEIGTAYQIAYIRSTIDTGDEFYRGEVEYLEEQMAYLELIGRDAARAFLKSPFVKDFEREFGPDIVRAAEAGVRLSDESVVDEQIEENRLCQEYSRVAASCRTVFRGEECNFYGLLRYMEDPDRDIRREAYTEWAKLYEGISEKLSDIYIKLVKIRRSVAEKLGFSSYPEMAYLKNMHFYYGADEVAAFREQVVKYIVPLADRLYKGQAGRLGTGSIKYYDEEIKYPEGNALPKGSEGELVAAAAEMYGDMSDETGSFFSFMTEHSLFDLTTRPGKHLGGYCTFLDKYKAPFIFSNFNGTSADVDVLTHEAGHAFQAYTASRVHPLSSQIWSTNEISEIHSMTMELYAYPYMGLFFGKDAEKYCRAHFEATIETVPYLCLVDHFQHRVYAEENLTAARLKEIWRGLERTYLPWRDYDGVEFLEEGGFWMQKQHIFLYPFYYIDYALAQMGAFELFGRYRENRETAWDDYMRLCRAGGSMPYYELLKYAHLSDPFDSETVERITAEVEKILKEDRLA